MEAIVKPESRFISITAFGGRDYSKVEWRPVPAGCEDEARQHELLDVRETPVVEVVPPISEPTQPPPPPTDGTNPPLVPENESGPTGPVEPSEPEPEVKVVPTDTPKTDKPKGKNK